MRKYLNSVIAAIILLIATAESYGSAIETISANGYAVFSGRNLSTGNNVFIEGNSGVVGSTWLANNTTVGGDVFTGTTFSTGNNVKVAGDITCGRSFWIGNNSTVGGDKIHSNPNLMPVGLPPITSGTDNLWYNKNSNINLTPGDYGTLGVSKSSKIYLTSGTYNFKSIWFDKDVEIILDTSQGNVVINSVGSFSTGQNVSLSGSGDGAAFVISGNHLSLGNNNNFAATLISNNGISISNNSLIDGMVYSSKDVWLSNNVAVTGENHMAAIPEPATALLLLTAFPYFLKRTKKE